MGKHFDRMQRLAPGKVIDLFTTGRAWRDDHCIAIRRAYGWQQ
jgi:hypothetical protein